MFNFILLNVFLTDSACFGFSNYSSIFVERLHFLTWTKQSPEFESVHTLLGLAIWEMISLTKLGGIKFLIQRTSEAYKV